MSEPCEFKKEIFEMSGNIKTLIANVENIDKKLEKTCGEFTKHIDESVPYRRSIDILNSVVVGEKDGNIGLISKVNLHDDALKFTQGWVKGIAWIIGILYGVTIALFSLKK